jgi:hypothetical protein
VLASSVKHSQSTDALAEFRFALRVEYPSRPPTPPGSDDRPLALPRSDPDGGGNASVLGRSVRPADHSPARIGSTKE